MTFAPKSAQSVGFKITPFSNQSEVVILLIENHLRTQTLVMLFSHDLYSTNNIEGGYWQLLQNLSPCMLKITMSLEEVAMQQHRIPGGPWLVRGKHYNNASKTACFWLCDQLRACLWGITMVTKEISTVKWTRKKKHYLPVPIVSVRSTMGTDGAESKLRGEMVARALVETFHSSSESFKDLSKASWDVRTLSVNFCNCWHANKWTRRGSRLSRSLHESNKAKRNELKIYKKNKNIISCWNGLSFKGNICKLWKVSLLWQLKLMRTNNSRSKILMIEPGKFQIFQNQEIVEE